MARQVAPRRAGLDDPERSVNNLAIADLRGSPGAIALGWKQRPKPLPLIIRETVSA